MLSALNFLSITVFRCYLHVLMKIVSNIICFDVITFSSMIISFVVPTYCNICLTKVNLIGLSVQWKVHYDFSSPFDTIDRSMINHRHHLLSLDLLILSANGIYHI